MAARRTPKPSPIGKLQVGEDDGRTRLPQLLHGLRFVARLEHGVALRFERMAQHRPQRILVFDEENGE